MNIVKRVIKYIPMVCILCSLSFTTTKATELVINRFYFTQLNECQFTFYGYFLNQDQSDFSGPVNISTQVQDNKFQYFYGDVSLRTGDSIRFWFTANLCSKEQHDIFMRRPLTDKWEVQRGPDGNGGDYSAVNACIWIEENNNQANKSCEVSMPHRKFEETVRRTGKKKGRNNLNENNKNEYDENVDLSFNIFPNPLVNITYLLVNSFTSRDISLQIINNTGAVVKQFDNHIPVGSNFIEIDMNEFGPGIYYFRILGASTLVSNTILKLH